jgi:hypothetical protein
MLPNEMLGDVIPTWTAHHLGYERLTDDFTTELNIVTTNTINISAKSGIMQFISSIKLQMSHSMTCNGKFMTDK